MKRIFLTGFALLLSLASTTLAQENRAENQELGRMWTFDDPPLAYLDKAYGFKPNQEWLDSLRLGSLRLGEDAVSVTGSASFVSPEGLILTSARCVRHAVAMTRPKDLEMIKTGFVAAALEQEFRLKSGRSEWLTAAQLVKISNVTDDVKREADKQTILDAARRADPELVPQIVSLYQGCVHRLYQYRVYDDVRLVVLPHVQAAHFGGDPDNFTYPRHSLDFAFLRAYEDGKPADTTKHYFKWKPGGAKEGELVLVAGSPGKTMRLATLAQLEFERDVRIPMELERLTNSLSIWMDPRSGSYSGTFDPENPSKHWAWVRTVILGLETDIKAARGNLHGVEDAKRMAQKTAAEQAFQRRVMADEQLAAQYGDLWNRIASAVQERRKHEARMRFHTAAGCAVLGVAVAIVRLCDPAEAEEHRELARKVLDHWAGTTINSNFHMSAHVLDHLVRSRNWLPEDDPFFTNVLGGRSAEEFLEATAGEQARSSRDWPGYPESREALVAAGWQGVRDSELPVIVAARELVILMRENERLGAELDAKDAALDAELARALFACYGREIGPDATNTPRFTDGVVEGFPFNGTIAPHRTTFYGLYARNAEFDDEYPFNLAKVWIDRKDRIDMTQSVNFASTNDISRGNSGSVVVNKELEVVGVVVDGNIESLHNDFVFRDDVPRAVSVHVDGIMEALVKVYDAQRVVTELTAR